MYQFIITLFILNFSIFSFGEDSPFGSVEPITQPNNSTNPIAPVGTPTEPTPTNLSTITSAQMNLNSGWWRSKCGIDASSRECQFWSDKIGFDGVVSGCNQNNLEGEWKTREVRCNQMADVAFLVCDQDSPQINEARCISKIHLVSALNPLKIMCTQYNYKAGADDSQQRSTAFREGTKGTFQEQECINKVKVAVEEIGECRGIDTNSTEQEKTNCFSKIENTEAECLNNPTSAACAEKKKVASTCPIGVNCKKDPAKKVTKSSDPKTGTKPGTGGAAGTNPPEGTAKTTPDPENTDPNKEDINSLSELANNLGKSMFGNQNGGSGGNGGGGSGGQIDNSANLGDSTIEGVQSASFSANNYGGGGDNNFGETLGSKALPGTNQILPPTYGRPGGTAPKQANRGGGGGRGGGALGGSPGFGGRGGGSTGNRGGKKRRGRGGMPYKTARNGLAGNSFYGASGGSPSSDRAPAIGKASKKKPKGKGVPGSKANKNYKKHLNAQLQKGLSQANSRYQGNYNGEPVLFNGVTETFQTVLSNESWLNAKGRWVSSSPEK